LRQHSEREQAQAELSEFFAVEDKEILSELLNLGYSRDTIFLLFLVPAIHVGWIDGSVTSEERAALIELARRRGMAHGSSAEAMLVDWLTNRPSDDFFNKNLSLIRDVLRTRPPGVRAMRQQSLADYCKIVANASGGFLGFGRMSRAQEDLIETILAKLEDDHREAAAKVVSEFQVPE
jgi:hypothetical protein